MTKSQAKTVSKRVAGAFALFLACTSIAIAAPKKRKPRLMPNPAASAPSEQAPSLPVKPGEKIQKIEIAGNKKIDREAILEKIGSGMGKDLSEDQVRKDIAAIHKLGYFDSVTVDFDAGTLKYTVKERPAIFRIMFFGNDQVSTDDLKSTLSIKTYDIYDENLVRDSARKLTKYYEDKGFYLAKVDYSVRPAKDKEMVELLFRVREYEKVKIRKIMFLGNKAFSDAQLKRTLRNTSEGGFFSWATNSGNFKELDFKNDLQILQYWYLNEGYVKFRHDPPVVTVSEDKKWVYITIRVDEGDRYKLKTVDFGGDLLFPKEELNNTLSLKSGDWFSISKRNSDILALTEKYQDLGYANVNVVPNIVFDDQAKTMDTSFDFEKGSLVRFGRITVKGNSKTRDKVIRRELKIREGELYSGSGMRISKENVERLGFFDQESVTFQTKNPNGRPDIADIEVNVKERPTGQFQLGAGYATTTKFFFTTQVAETNFMGKGQDIRFTANMAADRQNRSMSIGFTDPYAWDTLWSVGGDIYSEVTNFPGSYVEYRKGLGPRLGYPVGEYSRLFFGYQLEKLELPKDKINPRDIVLLDNLAREDGTKSAVSVTYEFDKRNNRMETTSGHYLRLREEYAGLGGNRNFVRSIVDGRFFHRVIGDLVFRTKIEGGGIWEYQHLPVQRTERFLLGGSNNLRGYAAGSIGPIKRYDNGATFNTGGIGEAFYMAELEFPIVKEVGFKFVVFYDAGDAFNKMNEVAIKQDYGWGFRWFSPLGPLRFEWGYPLKNKGRGTEFNFMIGPPF